MNSILKNQLVREILLRNWDPFGVGDNPNLAKEYDRFIPDVVRLIDNHCSFDQLNQLLIQIENELHAPIGEQERKTTVMALTKITKT